MMQTDTLNAPGVRVGIGQPLVGIAAGVVGFYAGAIAYVAWDSGRNAPAVLVLMIIAGISVFVGWRWPGVGLTAGIAILALVALGWVAQIARPFGEVGSWADLVQIWSLGAASAFVPSLGVVLLCSAIATRLPPHRR